MADFFIKNAWGRLVKKEGYLPEWWGYFEEDPELAEVRLTGEDYNRIGSMFARTFDEKQAALEKCQEIEQNAKSEKERYIKELEAEYRQVICDAEERAKRAESKVAELEKRMDELSDMLETEKSRKSSLDRIMRERANQVRGITPKKAHDGYLVLDSSQWREKYEEDIWDYELNRIDNATEDQRRGAIKAGHLKVVHRTAEAWRSILQSPYDVGLAFDGVRRRIEEELDHVLDDLGVTERVSNDENGIYCDFSPNARGLYRWRYRRNCRTRFWEIEIYTTDPLELPESRLLPHKIRTSQNQKREKKKNTVQSGEDLLCEAMGFDENDFGINGFDDCENGQDVQ